MKERKTLTGLTSGKLVGILGVFPFAGATVEKIEHGLEHLQKDGYRPIFLENLENIRDFDAADICLNWVVSASGLPTAQYLEKEKGIPYIASFPVGMRSMRQWRVHLAKLLGYEDSIEIPASEDNTGKAHKVLMIGDPILTAGVKYYFEDSMGYEVVRAHYAPIASVKQWFERVIERAKGHGLTADDREVSLEGSVAIYSWEILEKLQNEADIIIGDTIFRDNCKFADNKLWIELPDCISSCGLNELDSYQLFGKKGAAWLTEKLAAAE